MLPVIEDCPLAVCDYRSVRKEDLIACDRVIPTRAGEVYYLKHKEHHQWSVIHFTARRETGREICTLPTDGISIGIMLTR